MQNTPEAIHTHTETSKSQSISYAKFNLGQIVQHKYYGFRGIIFDVDFEYSFDDEWYEVACNNLAELGLPPLEKKQPFYHILSDGSDYESYVSEQNLQLDDQKLPIEHTDIEHWFKVSYSGQYLPRINYN